MLKFQQQHAVVINGQINCFSFSSLCEKREIFCVSCCSASVHSSLISTSFQSVSLQEENPYLQQQQASSLMSGVCLEKVRLAKSNPPLLRTRLKRAAFCIARLSREKQQLIEMVNRLHGQNTTAGLTGTHTHTHTHTHQHSDYILRAFGVGTNTYKKVYLFGKHS